MVQVKSERSRKTPLSARRVIFFANTNPPQRAWRRYVVRHFDRDLHPPEGMPIYGIGSRDELMQILTEFRSAVDTLITLPGARSYEGSVLLRLIEHRAQLQHDRHYWASDKRVFRTEKTANGTFSELLFAQILFALQKAPRTCFRRCETCRRYFFEPTRRLVGYCSQRCRDRARVDRYRERNRERYLAYQRSLMAERRSDDGRPR